MNSWQTSVDFLTLLQNDEDVKSKLKLDELKAIFDYNVYLKHVDAVFERLGLNKVEKKVSRGTVKLAPRTF
jgi:adenylosuccinate lyase